MEELKNKYNYTLQRFENGCMYLGEHKNEIPKFLPEMIKITKDLGIMIDMFAEKYDYVMTNDEIQKGF